MRSAFPCGSSPFLLLLLSVFLCPTLSLSLSTPPLSSHSTQQPSTFHHINNNNSPNGHQPNLQQSSSSDLSAISFGWHVESTGMTGALVGTHTCNISESVLGSSANSKLPCASRLSAQTDNSVGGTGGSVVTLPRDEVTMEAWVRVRNFTNNFAFLGCFAHNVQPLSRGIILGELVCVCVSDNCCSRGVCVNSN